MPPVSKSISPHPRGRDKVLDIHVDLLHLRETMTPLAFFMDEQKWTDAALAKLVGRERSTITKLRRGQAVPSLDLALKIAALSEGKVPVTAYPRPKKPQRMEAAE